ncbi:MAG: hypothetical protein K0U29_03860 [Gammaproteobacteria bacterium]|nr:hypothetical protein [Gammaproteobacteria bacterium]MCH9744049.1 hypothetical protein [Gammaproteobacteria bacterium]
MSKLTLDELNNLSDKYFGLIRYVEHTDPRSNRVQRIKERRYPMPDVAHARSCKGTAAMEFKKQNLTLEEKMKIDSKADRIIAQSRH